jgi:hypothetical protein
MIESPPLDDKDEEFYSDELDDEETRSTSPSKLTARQRAKGNKDLQETLVSLPGTCFYLYNGGLSRGDWSGQEGYGVCGYKVYWRVPVPVVVHSPMKSPSFSLRTSHIAPHLHLVIPNSQHLLALIRPTFQPHIHNLFGLPSQLTPRSTTYSFANDPEAGTKKAQILTEAERIQRREESARRRKRQMEQKLQDEQVCLLCCSFLFFNFSPALFLLFSWSSRRQGLGEKLGCFIGE